MELLIFGRFHARPGAESALEAAVREVVVPSRQEAGCLGIDAFRSNRDSRPFYIHSRWVDGAAFELPASLVMASQRCRLRIPRASAPVRRGNMHQQPTPQLPRRTSPIPSMRRGVSRRTTSPFKRL